MKRPPIGLLPKNIWKEIRFNEVAGAITRYCEAGLPIPPEWVKEYHELWDLFKNKQEG